MNRENIQRVRDRIAKAPARRFAMNSYFGYRDQYGDLWDAENYARPNAELAEGSCNTCACIAGHALAELEPKRVTRGSIANRAAKVLGLTTRVAGRLFEPNNHDAYFQESSLTLAGIGKAHAVRVLDHLLATGEVDWKSTRRAKKAVS